MKKSEKLLTHRFKTLKSEEWFKLVVAGDFHYGHKKCDVKSIKEMVKWLAAKDAASPRTWRVVLTGDLTENILPTSKGSAFELSVPDPIDQEDGVVELLNPIKHLIIAAYDGNHSYRSTLASGHSPDKEIIRKLGIQDTFMGYSGYFRIVFPKASYNIWGEHGAGASRTVAGSINSMKKMSLPQTDADLYIRGHSHSKIAYPELVKVVENGRVVMRKRIYVTNGSYLNDPEYCKRGGWPYGVPGIAKVMLNTQRKDVHCSV